jgi:hypothetical protein
MRHRISSALDSTEPATGESDMNSDIQSEIFPAVPLPAYFIAYIQFTALVVDYRAGLDR